MTNEDIIQQLMFRRGRIDELIALQTNPDAKVLLHAERQYVEAQIDYRSKHGGLNGVKLT